MAWLGRYRQGDEIDIPLLVRDAARRAVLPDRAPVVMVYGAGGEKLLAATMPVLDRYGTTGLFNYRLQLGAAYPANAPYRIAINYAVAGQGFLVCHHFDVMPGGHQDGVIVAMHHFERPHATYLVQQTSTGLRVFGRNPSVV